MNEFHQLSEKYEKYKEDCRKGKLGETAKFWLTYLDLMHFQNMIRLAVQENNIDMLIDSWKYFLPWYFALNKTNYARYGSYYYNNLVNMEQLYPGLKHLRKDSGISVQAQESFPSRTSIDQRGEQTINKDSKTVGGIKGFANEPSNILKWIFTRPEQAKNTYEMKNMAGMKVSNEYKSLRRSQVIKTESKIQNVVSVLSNEYINPFELDIDMDGVANLSSGVVNKDFNISKSYTNGETEFKEFVTSRLHTGRAQFNSPIPRKKLQLFKSPTIKIQKSAESKITTISLNRNMIGKLLSLSTEFGKPIDFKEALCYPLSPIPLSLANGDGSRRVTQKSKLSDIIISSYNPSYTTTPPEKQNTSYIVDLIAHIRTQTVKVRDTFEEYIISILEALPKGFSQIELVADVYRDYSIKNSERLNRGTSEKIRVKSMKSKIPRDLLSFLKNGDNKNRLIELIFEYITTNKHKCIDILQTSTILLSNDEKCLIVSANSLEEVPVLNSNQEEADTKVILHSVHYLNSNPNKYIIIRSPSGDTDILVLCLSIVEQKERAFLDQGTGKSRKLFLLSQFNIDHPKSLIGFHCFTGNDFISSFFKRGKTKCWEVMNSNPLYQRAFEELGRTWEINEQTVVHIELFVCKLYSAKAKKVNEARYELYEKKYTRNKKIIGLSNLPPCEATLLLHLKRSNYVAKIWKSCLSARFDYPEPYEHGWNNDFTIKWIELPFPENIEDLLVEEPVRKHENHFNEEFEMEQENLEEIGLDEDSDDEEDEW